MATVVASPHHQIESVPTEGATTSSSSLESYRSHNMVMVDHTSTPAAVAGAAALAATITTADAADFGGSATTTESSGSLAMEVVQQIKEFPCNTQCAECQNRNPDFVAFLAPPAILVNDMEGLQLHQNLGGLGVLCCSPCSGYHMQVGNSVKRLQEGQTLTSIEHEALRASGNRIVNEIWEATMDGYDKDIDDDQDEGGEERSTYMYMKYTQLRYFDEAAYLRHMVQRKRQQEESITTATTTAEVPASVVRDETTAAAAAGNISNEVSVSNLGYGDEQEYGNGFSSQSEQQLQSQDISQEEEEEDEPQEDQQQQVHDAISKPIRRRRNLSVGADKRGSSTGGMRRQISLRKVQRQSSQGHVQQDANDNNNENNPNMREGQLRRVPSARGSLDNRRTGMRRISSMRIASSTTSLSGMAMASNEEDNNNLVAGAASAAGPGGRRRLSRQSSMPAVTRSLALDPSAATEEYLNHQPNLQEQQLLLQQAEGALARMKGSLPTRTSSSNRRQQASGRRGTGSHSPKPPSNRSHVSMRPARSGSMGQLPHECSTTEPNKERTMRGHRRTASLATGPSLSKEQQEVNHHHNNGTSKGLKKRVGSAGQLSRLTTSGGDGTTTERTGRLKKSSSVRSLGNLPSSDSQQSEKTRRKQRTIDSTSKRTSRTTSKGSSSTSPKRSSNGSSVSPKRSTSGRSLVSHQHHHDDLTNKPQRSSSGRNLGSRGIADTDVGGGSNRPQLDKALSLRRISAGTGSRSIRRQNSSKSCATAGPVLLSSSKYSGNHGSGGESTTLESLPTRQRESSRDCRGEISKKVSKRGSLDHHLSSRGNEESQHDYYHNDEKTRSTQREPSSSHRKSPRNHSLGHLPLQHERQSSVERDSRERQSSDYRRSSRGRGGSDSRQKDDDKSVWPVSPERRRSSGNGRDSGREKEHRRSDSRKEDSTAPERRRSRSRNHRERERDDKSSDKTSRSSDSDYRRSSKSGSSGSSGRKRSSSRSPKSSSTTTTSSSRRRSSKGSGGGKSSSTSRTRSSSRNSRLPSSSSSSRNSNSNDVSDILKQREELLKKAKSRAETCKSAKKAAAAKEHRCE